MSESSETTDTFGFDRVLTGNLSFKVATKVLPPKGNLVYEYNPFRNYRLSEDKYEYKGLYYTLQELKDKERITYDANKNEWVDVPENQEAPQLRESGELVDFITNELDLDLEHPIDIQPLYSYDGSVNLILNDGKNTPKLVNSRFSAIGRNKYLIVDRKGNYDTNIYDLGTLFSSDVSLHKQTFKIPQLKFLGTVSGGDLSIGNYFFYFRYLDVDGNETDFVAESGLVSVFIGTSPSSVRSGFRNENSHKIVKFVLSNIDTGYLYVQVYYTKATSDINENPSINAYRIELKFLVNTSLICEINITGSEEVTEVPISDVNPFYLICDNANALAICLNRLFLANINKPDIDYIKLLNASLYFLPYLQCKNYNSNIDLNYITNNKNNTYTDSTFIYNYTGYWDLELYRLGIVYILGNNTLSPVFNIRGAEDITEYSDGLYSNFLKNGNEENEIPEITYTEEGFIVSNDNSTKQFENAKGVVSFKYDGDNPDKKIFGIDIRVNKRILTYLLTKHNIKGFFFVRLKRIPITLCLALTIGIDPESRTPVLPIDCSTNSQILNSLGLKGGTNYICRNKKSGKIVNGDTIVKKPDYSLEKALIITGGALIGMMIPGIGIMGGSLLGWAASTALPPGGYDYAYNVYSNDEDWEVYAIQSRPKSTDNICYIAERFITDAKLLELNFEERLYFIDKNKIKTVGAICPDYDVNSPYYNSIFNGGNVVIQKSNYTPTHNYLNYDVYDERHFYNTDFTKIDNSETLYECGILGVEDNVKLVAIGDTMFSARAGEAEEAFRYKYIGTKEKMTSSYNLLRGSFGPYLAITGFSEVNTTINIKIPGYNKNNFKDYFKIRFNDKSSFYAISDRIDLENLNTWFTNNGGGLTDNAGLAELLKLRNTLYRGDCYICLFTHRLNRNFQDPSSPINDDIVDSKCWALNYEVNDGTLKVENFDKVNLGDINAILLGMWVTSTYRSSRNLNIRNINDSIVDEVALTGHPRGYYPYFPISVDGSYKVPEALCYNSGFERLTSERYNYEVPDVPAIKNNFSTRIMYSDILISDAFKNGFRVFKGTNYRDYPITYGSITKLIELSGNLLCVFEHGIALIPVNERAVAGEGSGGPVYINTSNILPENPKIISDVFGSLWKDSIIKTPKGVYGVDTVAKKIWFTNGYDFKCISDFQVNEFLNNNISLTERELTPIIGIRNVKTHYNAFKQDVMFTFYDNTYGFEEKVWNLCFNEFIDKFVTFYSWVPSFSENIYNTYFSFDRNTSKWIAKLGLSKTGSLFASGITLSNNIIKQPETTEGLSKIGELVIDKDLLPEGTGVECDCEFKLERDNYGNYNHFKIDEDEKGKICLYLKNKDYEDLCAELFVRTDSTNNIEIKPSDSNYELGLPLKYDETKRRIWLSLEELDLKGKVVTLLNIKATVTATVNTTYQNVKDIQNYVDSYNDNTSTYNSGYFEYVVAVIPEYNLQFLTTDFWKHGQSGIIDLKDTIKPTHWYGKQHPFEFEFIVADNIDKHKIFDNLLIISNKAAPESFHYEIVGECYDFAKDKKNMYIRQEATKELYLFNGSDIVYDHNYTTLNSVPREINDSIDKYDKSTIFPLYYCRQDTINEIEDYYHLHGSKEEYSASDPNFSSLSGAEIVRYPKLDEYRIWNHAKAVDIHDFQKGGRMRGNMQYKEDKWDVQINPINLVQKNETKNDWINVYGKQDKKMVPAECNLFRPPAEVYNKDENQETVTLPPDWERNIVNWGISDKINKEVKLKDKFIKIRVRYSGKDLAVISALKILYSISYA